MKKILTIESSCDEFSVAIMIDGKIKTNIISSQISEHTKYGGIIPELASRLHVKNFFWVLSSALKEAAIPIETIDIVSYTAKPGLIGSLIIGKIVAQTIALYLNVPCMEMDHIQGHIYAANIEQKFEFPLLSLVASGGHTQIFLLKKQLDFNLLGTTHDDAVGECYDKIARALGFGYPGGAKIDKLASLGNENTYQLPLSMQDDSYDFSYSGLKTASLNLINKLKENLNINDFCASFQKAAILTMVQKFKKAIEEYKPKMISIAGGVSANSRLRKEIKDIANDNNIKISIPIFDYCTDNGAMIAELTNEYLLYRGE